MNEHEIIVSNIGTVYSGKDETKAAENYVVASRESHGKASGETVTWMQDGDIRCETEGSLYTDEKELWQGNAKQTERDRYKGILLRFVKPGDAVYTVTLKHSRTSYSRHTMLLVVNSQGDIENITALVARFLNERISYSTDGIIANNQSELISYLAIKLFNSSTALTERKL